MLSREQQELRLECLKLATSFPYDGDRIRLAGQFYDFVTGSSTEREETDAA